MPAWTEGFEKHMKRQGPAPPPMPTPEEIAFTNAPAIIAQVTPFFAVAATVVLLRCYVRLFHLKVFGIDDYVMVFAMLLAAGTYACFIIECHYGLGKHFMVMLLMNPASYTMFAKVLYVHSILVMVAISAVKVSIAFFLVRLSTRAGLYTRFIYGVVGFIILMTIACMMTLIFQCFPVEAAWDSSLRPPPMGTGTAKCYNMTIFRNLGLMNSSFNIVTDVLFATLPIPLIWQLQLNRRTKISLVAVLSLGWFACAAGIIKAVQQWHVLEDPDWTVNDSFNIWNFIELTIGIIAASLPSLKPLFNWFLDGVRAITSGGRSKGSGYKMSGYKGANSLGYHKTEEVSNKSIALNSITTKGDTTPKSPYNVRITTNATGLADKEAWDMVRANSGSDESILPLQHPDAGAHGIVITRDVRIS